MGVVRKEISDRSAFGKLIKWTFIGFNVLMLIWLVAGLGSAGEATSGMTSEAEQAGAAIGTALGVGLILTLWTMGDVILGILVLLTRRKKLIEIEE